ncbi:hypothetical protein DYB32_009268 [Aphanomyces invadans]|uniref:C2H2-type domain-containing protein n=1 Tax=Aphanomyces invadans TaxID=157072 RepID=A0A3R6VFG1_9STRA|nr:hypothetical protein DYB32_009268 [Aphanomyces invadans]
MEQSPTHQSRREHIRDAVVAKGQIALMDEPDFLHATPECLLPPEAWVNKKERFRCHVCAQKFNNIYRRRHHCRMVHAHQDSLGLTVKVCTPCAYEDASQAKRRRPRSPISFRTSRRLEHITNCSDDESNDEAATKDLLNSPVLSVLSSSQSFATPSAARRSISAPVHDLDFDEARYSGPLHCPSAPCLINEIERLGALKSLQILYSPPEETFNVICELAATTLHCPMAIVSFMDLERQWFKAKVGFSKNHFSRRISFCAHALATPEPTIVLDTRLDPRYTRNPLVTDYGVAFYAAVPLVTADGWPVGTLAVFDYKPHPTCDVSSLLPLARGIMKQLDERKANIQGSRRRRQAASFDDRCHATSLVSKKVHATPTFGPQKTTLSAMPPPLSLEPIETVDPGVSPLTSMRSSSTMQSAASSPAPKMESILFDLLNKTSETQQQLANQQGTMFATLGHHSEQIGKISEALARLESKLGSPVA